jgi:hypothetical protein
VLLSFRRVVGETVKRPGPVGWSSRALEVEEAGVQEGVERNFAEIGFDQPRR